MKKLILVLFVLLLVPLFVRAEVLIKQPGGKSYIANQLIVDSYSMSTSGRIATINSREDLAVYESTMVGDETFTASYTYQKRGTYILDAGGSDRNFNPSGTSSKGFEVRVINIGRKNIVFDSATLAEVVTPGTVGVFIFNGALWVREI